VPAETARLLIFCPDRRGIVAAVAGFIFRHNGNILEADQHTDREHGEFFMRIEIDPVGFDLDRATFSQAWEPIAREFEMRWRMHWGDDIQRMAILVSKQDHCLNDLLWRWKTGELNVHIPVVISNHETLRGPVEAEEIPFLHLPVTPERRAEQEALLLAALREHRVNLVVLARYMQILSPLVVDAYPERIINIHHSFLPAFAGAKPYHQAYERGVKIIGATSHYVTSELDQGPIIAQAVAHVDHRDTVDELVRKGRDLERLVFATAVRLHAEDKVLVSRNKTVVFD
jgi:formyltetrahydrofolate deformylase